MKRKEKIQLLSKAQSGNDLLLIAQSILTSQKKNK
jgi:hypothetical protein